MAPLSIAEDRQVVRVAALNNEDAPILIAEHAVKKRVVDHTNLYLRFSNGEAFATLSGLDLSRRMYGMHIPDTSDIYLHDMIARLEGGYFLLLDLKQRDIRKPKWWTLLIAFDPHGKMDGGFGSGGIQLLKGFDPEDHSMKMAMTLDENRLVVAETNHYNQQHYIFSYRRESTRLYHLNPIDNSLTEKFLPQLDFGLPDHFKARCASVKTFNYMDSEVVLEEVQGIVLLHSGEIGLVTRLTYPFDKHEINELMPIRVRLFNRQGTALVEEFGKNGILTEYGNRDSKLPSGGQRSFTVQFEQGGSGIVFEVYTYFTPRSRYEAFAKGERIPADWLNIIRVDKDAGRKDVYSGPNKEVLDSVLANVVSLYPKIEEGKNINPVPFRAVMTLGRSYFDEPAIIGTVNPSPYAAVDAHSGCREILNHALQNP